MLHHAHAAAAARATLSETRIITSPVPLPTHEERAMKRVREESKVSE